MVIAGVIGVAVRALVVPIFPNLARLLEEVAPMISHYQPLPLHRLESGAGYFQPPRQPLTRVTLDHPAVAALTDFSRISVHIAELSTPLGAVQRMMMKCKIRLLPVCDAEGCIVGLITSRDLDGDKAHRILAKAGVAWDELCVADLMTLRLKLQVLLMQDVSKARVGDIIATLRQVHHQHALVVDDDPQTGQPAVRGIFSLSQIALQLGLSLDPALRPTTYAELEQAGGGLSPAQTA